MKHFPSLSYTLLDNVLHGRQYPQCLHLVLAVPSADLGAGVRQRNVVIGARELLSMYMSSCMHVLCSLSAPATVLSYLMAQEADHTMFRPCYPTCSWIGSCVGASGGHALHTDFEEDDQEVQSMFPFPKIDV